MQRPRPAEGVQDLLTEMERLALPSPHFFPDDTLTDQPERVLAAEMIREKILRLMDKEIPHGIAVAIEKMKECPDGSCLDVDATIYCERESHKGMVIGKGGAMLKKICHICSAGYGALFRDQGQSAHLG